MGTPPVEDGRMWEQAPPAQQIFSEVWELEPDARREAVERLCGSNVVLRAEVLSIIEHAGAPNPLFEAFEAAEFDQDPLGWSDDVEDPTIGTMFGRYHVLRRIGAGGMAYVYEAEQDHPRRMVALKVIRPGIASETNIRRLQIEAEVLGRLDHPGIAQVYEASIAESVTGTPQPYFAMERVYGEPLLEYIRSRELDLRGRLRLFIEICDAVQHAHIQGVIHRDLKPPNIIVTDAGQPKVLDFGVARVTDSGFPMVTISTRPGQFVGTVPYMSPEQATGEPAAIDTRSDVYGLGVVLYEILTERLPYDLDSRMLHEALRIVRETPATPLGQVLPAARGDVETIVAKALEKDKTRRYQTAAELGADLGRFLRHEPIVARPPSRVYQIRKYVRRHRTLVAGVAATFLTLVLGIIGTSYGIHVANTQTAAATEREREATAARDESAEVTQFLETMLSSIDRDPDGNDVLVRDVLEQAAADLDDRFADRPATCARLHSTIGLAYSAMGRDLDALPHLERALELRRVSEGATKPQIVEAMLNLAIAHRRMGQYQPSLDLLLEAYEISATDADAANHNAVVVRAQLGLAKALLGNTTEAMAIVEEVLDAAYLTSDYRVISSLSHDLAKIAMARGDLQYATAVIDRAFDFIPSARTNPDYVAAIEMLAWLLFENGAPSDAESLLRQWVDTPERRRERGLFNLTNDLAIILKETGRLDEAEAIATELLEYSTAQLGAEHPSTCVFRSNLASILSRSGHEDRAITLFRDTARLLTTSLGPTHETTVRSVRELVASLQRHGAPDEALRIATETYQHCVASLPPDAESRLRAAITIYEVLRSTNDRAAIDALLQSCYDGYRDSANTTTSLLVLLDFHGSSLLDQGRLDEAEVALLDLLARLRTAVAPDHPGVIGALTRLARLYDTRGDEERAAACREELASIRAAPPAAPAGAPAAAPATAAPDDR